MKNSESGFWQERVSILLGIVILTYILDVGEPILVPIISAAFFAILLDPLVRRLERLGVNRVVGILLSMLAVIIVLSGLVLLFSSQLTTFSDQLPQMTARLKQLASESLAFMQQNLPMEQAEYSQYLNQGVQKLIDKSDDVVQTVVSTTTGFFSFFTLFPFAVFFLLYYKKIYTTFLFKIAGRKEPEEEEEVRTIVDKVSGVLQSYMLGMLAVVGILALLNTTGLLIIGIDHALFFGLFAAFLALIPYIGVIIGSLLPVLYALIMYDSLVIPVAVLGVFLFAQFMEGNFITPNIMSAQVSINPLVAIIALLVGSQLWGIAGMILFIPLVGMLKAVFDQIEPLRPYGYLLGNRVEYEKAKLASRKVSPESEEDQGS